MRDESGRPFLRPERGKQLWRRRSPPPLTWTSRAARGFHHLLVHIAAWIGRRLYESPPGRRLRGRIKRQLRVVPVEVRLGRLGPGFDRIRIALVSDLHLGSWAGEEEAFAIVQRLEREAPDLVCLAGDLIDHRAEDAALLRKPLGLLAPPLGVWAVPGNHEHFAEPGLRTWRHVLEECGVEVLVNRGARLRRGADSLWIAGVDDFWHDLSDLDAALHGCGEDEPVLLLSHHPDLFFEAAARGVDLQLSGHTHGGQITVAGRAPVTHSRLGLVAGCYEERGSQLFVGRGAGVTMLPLRVGALPEIPILTLRAPAASAGEARARSAP